MTPAFASAAAPVARLPHALASPQSPLDRKPLANARTVVEQGRKRARALVYGAGGAFRGLADPRRRLENMLLMNATRFADGSGFGGGGGRWGPFNGGRGDHHDDEEGDVDPSWGIAPSAHVLLRERSNEAYRLAVANLMAMSTALSAVPQTFVDPTVPVVVILTWMGASQKHVARYTKFYEDLGYEVVCIFNDLRTAIFPPASKAQAQRIGQIIEQQPSDRPVFVHAFSIGTGIYGILLDSLRNEKEKFDRFREKVTGVVFDSGPAPIFPNDVAKGLNTVFPMVSRALWERLANAFFFVTKARRCYSMSEDALRKVQFPSPQLYFYSGDDKVIPDLKNAVEDFVEKNKQRGVEVYKKFWEKSVHASHLKIHPDDYVSMLHSFLDRCMEVRQEKVVQVQSIVGH